MPQLAGKEVGPIGFGLMGLTWRNTPCPQEQAFEAMRAALKNGCNCWNGGEFYGPPDYNSLVLLERYFSQYPEDADKVIISIKGGLNPKTHQIDASPENTRRTLDDSIAQLKGRKKLDLFEFGRRDPAVPMKLTFDVIDKEYVQTGKVGGISLSEVRAETIHEAVKHTKVLAVEVELSLFATEVLENGVAAACAEYGIPLIAYSPIGRGMLTGEFKKLDDVPRTRCYLVEQVEAIAKKKGCTPAQLAINWTRALSRRPGMPTIIPIPGATTVGRVEENSKLIDIEDEEMAQIDAILAKFTPAGERYPAAVATNT
ncbi:pyridoxal reductase [Physcia stellaris]|nr:pyridoxal reductase [Physcia stellaris]